MMPFLKRIFYCFSVFPICPEINIFYTKLCKLVWGKKMQAELPLQESLMHKKKSQKFLPLENYLKFHLHTAFYQEHTCGLKKVKNAH